ncbi:MAG: GTPase, partial [Planctomycetota bacterium]
VAGGAANIGKSSLLNALAASAVAAVADEPGTTRDHVGVELALDGVAVRWLDTPGVSGAPVDAVDAEARQAVGALIESAALVVLCGDAGGPEPDAAGLGIEVLTRVLRVALRADRAADVPAWADVVTSAAERRGLAELAGMVRRWLVPDEVLADGRAWRFW